MTSIRGVDVASFQGIPRDWQAEAGDIQFAGVKFSELQPSGERYINPDAAADWAWLKAHGKVRIAYLFGHPATSSAESVALFLKAVEDAGGLDDGDVVALDSEQNDGRDPSGVAAWGLDVLQMLHKATGRRPLEYIDLSYAEDGNAAGHGAYPLWIADPSSPAGRPRVPGPWKAWAVHQYQITGPIDRDVANYGDGPAMARALGKPGPSKPAKGAAPMEFVGEWKLDGPVEIPPSRKPVTLTWKRGKSDKVMADDGAAEIAAAAVLLSSLNLRFANAGDIRVVLADRATGEEFAKDWREESGWCPVTQPFTAAKGGKYEVRVTNFGTLALTITAGRWQLVS
jgi:Glycosyl hydrolases family 25